MTNYVIDMYLRLKRRREKEISRVFFLKMATDSDHFMEWLSNI